MKRKENWLTVNIQGNERRVRECPFCGNTDGLTCSYVSGIWENNLNITRYQNYEDLVEQHGSACVKLSCLTCDTTMTEYDSEAQAGKLALDYTTITDRLIEKWNTRR